MVLTIANTEGKMASNIHIDFRRNVAKQSFLNALLIPETAISSGKAAALENFDF